MPSVKVSGNCKQPMAHRVVESFLIISLVERMASMEEVLLLALLVKKETLSKKNNAYA